MNGLLSRGESQDATLEKRLLRAYYIYKGGYYPMIKCAGSIVERINQVTRESGIIIAVIVAPNWRVSGVLSLRAFRELEVGILSSDGSPRLERCEMVPLTMRIPSPPVRVVLPGLFPPVSYHIFKTNYFYIHYECLKDKYCQVCKPMHSF